MPSIISNIDAMLHPKMVSMHVWRVTGAFIALYFSFLTVSNIPFADATALGFLKINFVRGSYLSFIPERKRWLGSRRRSCWLCWVMLVVQPSLGKRIYVLCWNRISRGIGVLLLRLSV
ncbi:hypothetical protein OK016_26680 [Vibrio chagasii]|nr:hypothetical protein [Vibrio chagasii]